MRQNNELVVDSSNDNYFGDFEEDLTEIETSVARRYMDLELVLSGEDDYTMNEVYDKLVELDAYESLRRIAHRLKFRVDLSDKAQRLKFVEELLTLLVAKPDTDAQRAMTG